MASSCIPGGGLRLDLEMMKAGATPPRSAHSAPSSTLSEASNVSSSSTSSVASLSVKRPRAPRKRPNQTYNEAAALLASMYPSVFPVVARRGPETAPPRLLGLASALADDPNCSDLLPPFPVLGHAAFLLRDLPHPQPPPTPWSPVPAKSSPSPADISSVSSEFRDPATPDAAAADELGELDFDGDCDFNADSFLGVDEGAAEGIDAIMGKLTMENDAAVAATSVNSYLPGPSIQTYVRNVMMLQLGVRHHGQLNKSQALKGQTVDTKWWMCPAIPVKDIAPAQQASVQTLVVPENKKKCKKKVVGREMATPVGQCRKAEDGIPHSANGDPGTLTLPETGLGLRLNSEEVLKAWCGSGSVFADGYDPYLSRSSADVLVKHSDSDLIKENATRGVIREGNILKMQHKQKQCTPVLSNKSRYYRPRVKGRFVSKAYVQQAAEEEKKG